MKSTILIVDDDIVSRKILKKYFFEQFDCLEAGDGKEALDIIYSGVFDIKLMLLDLSMPKLTGFEVITSLIKKSKNNFPTVVMTGDNDLDDQLKAFELGINDYISKPFNQDIVYERVMSVYNEFENNKKLKMKLNHSELFTYIPKIFDESDTIEMINAELNAIGSKNVTLLLFKLEGLKTISREYGALISNHIIKLVRIVIANNFSHPDIVGKIAEDEIVVYIKEDITDDEIADKMNVVLTAINSDSIISSPTKLLINSYSANADKNTRNFDMLKENFEVCIKY